MSAAPKTVERERDLSHLPVFSSELANCGACDLRAQCEAGKMAHAHRPANWNGIMVVGEGPGVREVAENRPFVGESGRLLRSLFESYGANLDDCYITNATLALPSKLSAPGGKDKGGLMERFPSAVYACLPRLEAEIAAVKPRVVLALGAAALVAMTGYEETKQKRTAFTCDNCDEDRKIGPIIECSARKDGLPCKKRYWADEAPPACTKCGASLAKQRPKRVKCPVCHGLKTRNEEITVFKHDYKITEVAGAVIDEKKHAWESLGVKYVVPTWHPSHILRGGEKGQFLAKPMQKHIRKALYLAEHDRDWAFEWDLTDDLGGDEAAQMLLEYVYETPPFDVPIACDIETEAWHTDEDGEEHELDARKVNLVTDIKVIGLASRAKGYALVVDTRNAQPVLLEALKRVLTDPNVRKSFHHGNYDVPVIRKIWGYDVQGYTDDTLIMHHVLYPDEPHKLSHVSFSFTYARIWKPPRNLHGREAHASFDDLAVYNARDCMLTDENFEYMDAALDRKGLRQVYAVDMRSQQQALLMHKNGMAVDLASVEKVGREALGREAEGLEEMRNILRFKGVANWRDFNPNKPVELGRALYDILGNKCAAFTTKGAPSTAKEAIARLDESPFKSALLLYRDANTFIKNNFERVSHGYGLMPAKNFHIWADGRIRALWKAFGTRTGRFSSSPNYQNHPKWTRALIVAPPGRRIFGCDYDQLELRIMAALSGDPTLIEKCLTADDKRKLEPDHDPHSFVARLAFGDTYVKLDLADPKHSKENKRCKCQTCTRKMLRDIVKRVIYGLMYGSGDQTVLDAIYNGGYDGPPITLNMIARVRVAVFKAFPRVLTWRERAVKLANERGYIESPIYHRRRHFPLGDIPVTEIYNFPIQCLTGTTRILTQQGYVPIADAPRELVVWDGASWQPALRLDKGAEPVWAVELDNGQTLETNAGHFLLTKRGWREVADLAPGVEVAQPLAVPREFAIGRRIPQEDVFYWLGYFVGNGSWDAQDALRFCFGTRIGRATHADYAQRFFAWAASLELSPQKPQSDRPNLTTITLQNHAARELFAALGFVPGWTAHSKRVPASVWRASLHERQQFVLGLLEADGTLSNDPPALHMCNKLLLQDVQLLLRSLGIPARLYGPYEADRKGHLSWRLSIPGTLLAETLAYGTAVRARYPNDVTLDQTAIDDFLDAFPRNPFSYTTQKSYYTLWSRVAHGGQTNPHTLYRMWRLLGAQPREPIYAWQTIKNVAATDREAAMYTLHVQHASHRYDSAGFISKNSGGADIINTRASLLLDLIAQVDPTALYMAQVHDAVFFEGDANLDVQLQDLITRTMSWETPLFKGGPAMLFSAAASSADNWKDA